MGGIDENSFWGRSCLWQYFLKGCQGRETIDEYLWKEVFILKILFNKNVYACLILQGPGQFLLRVKNCPCLVFGTRQRVRRLVVLVFLSKIYRKTIFSLANPKGDQSCAQCRIIGFSKMTIYDFLYKNNTVITKPTERMSDFPSLCTAKKKN